MASKKEETAAWVKLKSTYPNCSISLRCEFYFYTHRGEDAITYKAFVDLPDRGWIVSGDCLTPMKAVDALIRRVKEIEDATNTPQ